MTCKELEHSTAVNSIGTTWYTFPAELQHISNRTIAAIKTVTPGLLVTVCVDDLDNNRKHPRWHVTHAQTGMKLTGDATSRKNALLIAGACGGLPIDWTKDQKGVFADVEANLLQPLREWLTLTLRR